MDKTSIVWYVDQPNKFYMLIHQSIDMGGGGGTVVLEDDSVCGWVRGRAPSACFCGFKVFMCEITSLDYAQKLWGVGLEPPEYPFLVHWYNYLIGVSLKLVLLNVNHNEAKTKHYISITTLENLINHTYI